MTDRDVLVTGGSGFIAGHVILHLLAAGHRVRTTVRSLDREAEVRAQLTEGGLPAGAPLSFVAADLMDDDGWAQAVAGIDTVLHVASPVLPGHVEDEDSLVRPAREGTLRVLRAAADAGVRRVVLTSAFHAVGFGQPHDHPPFTEDDWSPLDGPGMDAYGRSKVLAERAAWDFVAGTSLELVTLLPVAVVGPVLGTSVSGANHILQALLGGAMPGLTNLHIPIVDVRDVAAAHTAAVTADVAGRRVLVATADPATAMPEIAATLRRALGSAAEKVPQNVIPDDAVRAAARTDPSLRGAAADLGFVKRIDVTRLRTQLGIDPRPWSEAVVAAARWLVAKGLS
jgi:nucleoside-diphosphate-sugar epimerase